MKRSAGELSAVYIVSDLLSQHHKESEATDTAFESYNSHQNVILNNPKGGVGYFAEVHHTASFNVNQINADFSDRATQIDSRAFGSIDIQTDSGIAFNPKYYATAEQSYEAGAQLIQTESGIAAKYTGQHIVVPSDQLQEVLRYHKNALMQAQQQGNNEHYDALSSITFTDRIAGENGVTSMPLTYQEAKQGVLDMEQGLLPAYAEPITPSDGVLAGVEGIGVAIGLVTASELAPAMIKILEKIDNSEISVAQAGGELWQQLQQNNSLAKIASTTQKITTAGTLSLTTGMNASITTFLVTYVWDIVSLYKSFKNGKISQWEMMQRIKIAGLDRGVLSLLAYSAVSVAGPLGLLVPIAIQWLGIKGQEAKVFEHGLNQLFHNWLHQINETAQYKSEVWQLNHIMSLQNTARSNQNLEMQMKNTQTQKDLVEDFEKVIKNDQFDSIIEIKSDNMESQLKKQKIKNLAVITKITDTIDIDSIVQRFIIENENNKKIIESAALDAMVLLDPQETDDNNQNKAAKSLLKKLGDNLLYKGLTAQDVHIQKLTTAQIASMRIIKSLQQDQTLSLEFITLLQKHIGAFEEKLLKISNEQTDNLTKTYHSMSQVYVKLRNRIIDNEQKIADIEKNLALQEWLNLTNVQKYCGKTLLQLDDSLRLATIINEFIQHTEAKWTKKDLLVLNEMLYRTGLNQDNNCFKNMFKNTEAINKLFERLQLIDKKMDDSNGVKWISQAYQNHEFTLPEVFKNHPSNNTLWENVLILLWYIKSADIRPYRLQTMEIQKQNWLKGIDKINGLIEMGVLSTSLTKQVNILKNAILQFKLVVPIIGKYSVGKSTLLNMWLETDIQNTDLGACTSIPTEFHFASKSTDEKLILSYLDNEGRLLNQSMLISDYALINQQKVPIPNNIQHIQLYLNLPALALHPDLVLVDTPGLESNVGSHEQALMKYSGVVDSSFILCVSKNHLGEEEKRFVSRQYSLGKPISLLVCQEDLILKNERENVRQAIAEQAEFNCDYGIIRGCSSFNNDLKGFSDILNYIEEQKSYLFEQKFRVLVDGLMQSAKKDLEQRIDEDYTQDDLLQAKSTIEENIKNLHHNYEKISRKLSLNAKGNLANQVSSNVKKFINARKSNYLQELNQNLSGVQNLVLADIQNALELSIEQIVFPELQKTANQLEDSISLKYDNKIQPQGAMNNVVGIYNSNENLTILGGMIGGGAGLLMGATLTTMPFLIVPGAILGSFLKESIRKNKLQEMLYEQINEAYTYIDRVIPDYMENLVSNSLCQIYESLQAKLLSEQDKISAIDNQVQADKEEKKALLNKLQECYDELNEIMSELEISDKLENK